MAIIHLESPSGGVKALTAEMNEIFKDADFMSTFLEGVSPENLSITEPHRVFSVRLEDVLSRKLLSSAQETCWRYLLVHNDTAVAEADLELTSDGGCQFLGLHSSPYIEATIAALHYAETLDEVQKGDFEMRLLTITALDVVALWLHGEKDILIPLADMYYSLKSNTSYSEQEVLALIGEAAARKGETDLSEDAP